MTQLTKSLEGRHTRSARPSFANYLSSFWRARSTLAFLMCVPLISIIAALWSIPFSIRSTSRC